MTQQEAEVFRRACSPVFGGNQFILTLPRLPAFVVSTDTGFFEGLADLSSPQKSWFWKAEHLAAAFERGERPGAPLGASISAAKSR
jgi:hypothetical protein